MDAGPTPAFAIGLQAATASEPLYSLSFDEQGSFVLALFVAHADGGQLTCGELAGLPMDSWVLEVLAPNAPGTYPLSASNSNSFPPPPGTAAAVLGNSSSSSGEGIETTPITGQVIVTSAPADVAAQAAGAHLQGSFHIGFPEDPMVPPECISGGEGLPDGNFIEEPTFCICKDVNGNQVSICDGGPQCCVSSGPATIFADATFDALPCYKLCIAPDTEYASCEALSPDGGEEASDAGPDGGGPRTPDAG